MFPHQLTDRRAFDIARAMLDGFNRHYRLFRETSAAAKQRFEAADWHGQQRAQRERIEFYDLRVDEAVERLRSEFDVEHAVDGQLAAGQAALHRPADRPPPARAGRDLLQLGHRQAAAPQLLPQRLHLRAPGGQHRVHRERRAGGAAHLPRLLPDAARRCATTWLRIVDNFQLAAARSRTWSATSTTCCRRCCPSSAASGRAPTSRSRCCPACSTATRAPTWSARSSTASPRRRSRCRSCTADGGTLCHRRRAVRRGRPADAVQLRARLLHGRHGDPQRLRAVPAQPDAAQAAQPSCTARSACRSTARTCSTATSCTTCAIRSDRSASRRASRAW